MKITLLILTISIGVNVLQAQPKPEKEIPRISAQMGASLFNVSDLGSQTFDGINPKGLGVMFNGLISWSQDLETKTYTRRIKTIQPGWILALTGGYGWYAGQLTTCDIPEYYEGYQWFIAARGGFVFRHGWKKSKRSMKSIDFTPYAQIGRSKRTGTILLGGGTVNDTTLVEPTVGHIALTLGIQAKRGRFVFDLSGMPKIGKMPGMWNIGLRCEIWGKKFFPRARIRTPRFRHSD